MSWQIFCRQDLIQAFQDPLQITVDLPCVTAVAAICCSQRHRTTLSYIKLRSEQHFEHDHNDVVCQRLVTVVQPPYRPQVGFIGKQTSMYVCMYVCMYGCMYMRMSQIVISYLLEGLARLDDSIIECCWKRSLRGTKTTSAKQTSVSCWGLIGICSALQR